MSKANSNRVRLYQVSIYVMLLLMGVSCQGQGIHAWNRFGNPGGFY